MVSYDLVFTQPLHKRKVGAQVFVGDGRNPENAAGFYTKNDGKLYFMHPRDAFLVRSTTPKFYF